MCKRCAWTLKGLATEQEQIGMKKLTRTPLFVPGAAIFVLGWLMIFNNVAALA